MLDSRIRNALVALAALAATGCASSSRNDPALPLSKGDARELIREMKAAPATLERPVIVVGGYLDPGLGPWWTARVFQGVSGAVENDFRTIAFPFCTSFEQCRDKLIVYVDEEFPTHDPLWTTEVDVIAISMGGLVARHAAAPPSTESRTRRRLRVARLFTLSSPHRGARLAELPCFMTLHRDMREGSRFVRRLADEYETSRYELHAYVLEGDAVVGAENAAPPGEQPIRLSNPWYRPAHFTAVLDPRIVADIGKTLRGDEPRAVDRDGL